MLHVTGLADQWGKPETPLLASGLVTVVWIATVVVLRAARPVLTLVLAGIAYAVLSTLLGGVLSSIVHDAMRGPLATPVAIAPVLVLNAAWGAAAGIAASSILKLREEKQR